jgi:hypothetical protein
MNVLFAIFLAPAAAAAGGGEVCRDCAALLSDSVDYEVIVDRRDEPEGLCQCRGLFWNT